MKKFKTIFLVLLFAFVLAGCTSIEFSSETFDMKKGTTADLSTLLSASKGDVTYASSNNLVVTVDEKGTATAVDVGEAMVTATIKDKEATIKVIVTEQMPNSIVLRADEDLDFYIAGNTYQFTSSILPKNADQTVVYTSSNTSAATISEDGVLTVLSAGQTTIKAASVKDATKSDEYTVNCKLPEPEAVVITGDKTIELNETTNLSASITPKHAVQSISWSSEDEEVATVTADGVVTGVAVGKVNIVAKSLAKESVLAKYEVEVVIPAVKGVEISGTDNSIFVGASTQFTSVITPELAPQEVEWSTNDQTIATIDQTGLITGVSIGQVLVTVTSKADPTKSASAYFDVIKAPERPDNNVVLIDPGFTGNKFDSDTYQGYEFIEGYNLFTSLENATKEIKEGTIIFFKAGDIEGEITIGYSNVKIYGPHKGVSGKDSTRGTDEAFLKGSIKFEGQLENIEIDGIALATTGTIAKDPTGTFKNFKFVNNYSSNEADYRLTSLLIIDLATNAGLVNENIIVLHNYINEVYNPLNTTIFFRASNIKNLLVNDNIFFMCASSDEAEKIFELGGDFDGNGVTANGYGINGKVEFISNTLTSSQSHDIEILSYGTEDTTIDILDNNFAGKTWQYVTSSKIAISGYKGAAATIHVDYNVIYNGFRGVLIATNGVTDVTKWSATVNNNLFDFYDFQSGYVSNRLYNANNISVPGYNSAVLIEALHNFYRDSQSKRATDTGYASRLVGVTEESKTGACQDENELAKYTGSYSTEL